MPLDRKNIYVFIETYGTSSSSSATSISACIDSIAVENAASLCLFIDLLLTKLVSLFTEVTWIGDATKYTTDIF